MRIEETCRCGASLVIIAHTHLYRDEENARAEVRVWEQVDRWRELHADCCAAKPSGEGTHS